jgi:hypothetical protein
LPASPFDFRLRQQCTLFDTHSIGLHLSQNVIMDSDVVFLCSQDERLSREKANYYMPARCDAMLSALCMWLVTAGTPTSLGMPAARSSGEPLGWIRPTEVPFRGGRDTLLDRYRKHTDISHRAEVRTSHSTKSKKFSRAPVFVFWQLLRARQRIE